MLKPIMLTFLISISLSLSVSAQTNSTLKPFDEGYSFNEYLAKSRQWSIAKQEEYWREYEQVHALCVQTPNCFVDAFPIASLPRPDDTTWRTYQAPAPDSAQLSYFERIGQHAVALRGERLYSFALEPGAADFALVDSMSTNWDDCARCDARSRGLLVRDRTIYTISDEYGAHGGYLLTRVTLTPQGRFRNAQTTWIGSPEPSDGGWGAALWHASIRGESLNLHLSVAPGKYAQPYDPRRHLVRLRLDPEWSYAEFEANLEERLRAVGAESAAKAQHDALAPLAASVRLYQPVQQADHPRINLVLSCPLSSPELACSGSGVITPRERTHLDGNDAIYVWATGSQPAHDYSRLTMHQVKSLAREAYAAEPYYGDGVAVYRLPFDGAPPSVTITRGFPYMDGMFLETASELHVLVNSKNPAYHRWGWPRREFDEFDGLPESLVAHPPERQESPRLVTIPMGAFGAEARVHPRTRVSEVVSSSGEIDSAWFLGNALVYAEWLRSWDGTEEEGILDYASSAAVRVLPLDGTSPSKALTTEFALWLIEPIVNGALLIGVRDGEDSTPVTYVQTLTLAPTPRLGPAIALAKAHPPDEYAGFSAISSSYSRAQSEGEGPPEGPYDGPSTTAIYAFPVVYPQGKDRWGDYATGDADAVSLQFFAVSEDGSLRHLGDLASAGLDLDECYFDCWRARAFVSRGVLYAQVGAELIRAQVDGRSVREEARARIVARGEAQ